MTQETLEDSACGGMFTPKNKKVLDADSVNSSRRSTISKCRK